MLNDNPDQPFALPFSVIRDALDPLLMALTNLLDRQFPKELTAIPGLQPFLLVAMYIAKNTYEAIRYLGADMPKDPSRKLEFGLAMAPLVRSLADLLFTLVFISEDLSSRVRWYHQGGWRELKEEFDRYTATYGSLPEWQRWLSEYQTFLDQRRHVWGISDSEAAAPQTLDYWPIPGQMLRGGKISGENQRFLQFVNDWMYREMSASSHISAAGIIRWYGPLLLTNDQGREAVLSKLKSDGLFTATTLVVALCAEVNHTCRYEREAPLSYLWGVLVQYWRDAKDLYDLRYRRMLAPDSSP